MIRARLYAVAFAAVTLAAGLNVFAAASPDLAQSASAFVRSQAGAKINWEVWNDDLPRRAKAANKPVFVFIGSFLSELTRATCRQNFENAATVAYLNEHFLCVIVDREERPDLAVSAQSFLSAVKQTSGWPANIWLTPELRPYDGGGYLPPSEEWGKAGFGKVARQAGETWAGNPASCRTQADEAVSMMASAARPDELPKLTPTVLKEKLAGATAAWRDSLDATNGGFGSPPKNVEPELLRFLLRSGATERNAALATLRAADRGAIHDPVDGGFFRYTTDAAWGVPYPQKTLADQARIARAFLDAAEVTSDATLAAPARAALDYALNRLARPDGSFAAAEDGTADELIGYSTWTEADLDAALGKDSAAFKQAYGVKSGGNVSVDEDPSNHFQGRNFLFRATPPGDKAVEAILASALDRLRAIRAKHTVPSLDDRATTGAHGLMLAALSRAAAQLKEPRYLDAAQRLYAAVQKQLLVSPDGLRRLAGSTAAASPADYAAVALGCREYARAAKNPDADKLADRLLASAGRQFFDVAQGRYLIAPATMPAGIFVRVPATNDPVTAESLAVQAGAPADQVAAMTAALSASLLIEGVTVPGDVLLALSAKN